MKNCPRDFKRGQTKKGCYQKKSRKKLLQKLRSKKYELQIKRDNLKENIKDRSFAKRFRGKRFQSIYLNILPCFKKYGRSKHLIDFRQIFDSKFQSSKTEKISSILILTFLYSSEILSIISKAGCKAVIMCDALQREQPNFQSEFNPNIKIVTSFKQNLTTIDSSFHPKIIILKFETFVRVAVGTGNVLLCDLKSYANCLIVKDCPREYSSQNSS